MLEGLFGVLFALGRLQAQTSDHLRCLFVGFVFGRDFGAIFGQIMGVWGAKNAVFALERLQKSPFPLSLVFDRFGLHFGRVWGAFGASKSIPNRPPFLSETALLQHSPKRPLQEPL